MPCSDVKSSDGNSVVGSDAVAHCFAQEWHNILNESAPCFPQLLPNNMRISSIVTKEENQLFLLALPTLSETEGTVHSLKKWKDPGSDGFTAEFFQTSWDIIKFDMLGVV